MFCYSKKKTTYYLVTTKMPNKKKTSKNKVMWLLVTMAKKHIVIRAGSLERQDWQKKLMIIGLQ
jgi:hypothetical protein